MEVQTQVNKRSLAEEKVQDIRTRLDTELMPAIRAVEQEMANIDSTTANWRDAASAPANIERLNEDRARLFTRRAILTDARDRAEAELRLATAQVEVDQLAEIRAEFQRIGDARTQSARDLIAIAEMAAAKVSDMERQREQMASLAHGARRFFLDRASGMEEERRSVEFNELLRLLKETEVRAGFEHVIGMNTPQHVWLYEYRHSPAAAPDAVRNIGGQCKGGLITFDRAMQRLIADAKGA